MKASWRLVLGAGYLKVVGYSLRKIVPFFFFLTFFFFVAAPTVCRSSQARDQTCATTVIRATAMTTPDP